MERLVIGSIVVIPFPYTDLTSSKRRPALIIHDLEGEDFISCAITSQNRKDKYCINLTDNDFRDGKLNRPSFIRISHIFTVDRAIILYSMGTVKDEKLKQVIDKICKFLKHS